MALEISYQTPLKTAADLSVPDVSPRISLGGAIHSSCRSGVHTLRAGFKLVWALALIAFLMGYGRSIAFARPNYVAVVTGAYTLKGGGAVEKASQACGLCHDGAPPKLNAYGVDVKGALESAHSKTLTAAMLHSLDSKDSDGDGFDNGTEIAADTLPGDPTSKPAGSPPPKASAADKGIKKEGDKKGAEASSSEPNVFDLKGLVLPKHGQHPIMVHFPVALFIISLLFDLLALWRKDVGLAAAAYLNLTIAALSSPVAVLTGFLAWQFAYGGISGESFKGTLQQHLIAGVITTVLIGILWGMRFATRKSQDRMATPAYLVLALITMALLSFTGHVGGFLSGVN